MAKKTKKNMAKAGLPARSDLAARIERDLFRRNVRTQREILALGRQLSALIKRADKRLADLAVELIRRNQPFLREPEDLAAEHVNG